VELAGGESGAALRRRSFFSMLRTDHSAFSRAEVIFLDSSSFGPRVFSSPRPIKRASKAGGFCQDGDLERHYGSSTVPAYAVLWCIEDWPVDFAVPNTGSLDTTRKSDRKLG